MPSNTTDLQTLEDKLPSEKLKDVVIKVMIDNIAFVAEHVRGDKGQALKSLISLVVKASKGHTNRSEARKALLKALSNK
jgi:Asp-tRNA(Asn)/Glu-tRNA(Gln) amidotransferase B subunit